MHCTLDLELSPEIFHSNAPTITNILAKGSVKTHSVPLSAMRSHNAGFDENSAMAMIAAQADGIEVRDGDWLMADPVHLALQRDGFSLYPEVPVQLSQQEAIDYQTLLNQHFKSRGISFFLGASGQWYVNTTSTKLAASAQDMTHPVHAMGRSVEAFMPQSSEGNQWLQLQNEIQMLLFECSVSQIREQKKQVPVNSVWFYGGGQTPAVSNAKPSHHYYVSNASFYRGLAQTTQADFIELPQRVDAIEALLRQHAASNMVLDLTRYSHWEDVLGVCTKLLTQRIIKQLSLQLGMPNQTLIAKLKPFDLWCFWRKQLAISDYW